MMCYTAASGSPRAAWSFLRRPLATPRDERDGWPSHRLLTVGPGRRKFGIGRRKAPALPEFVIGVEPFEPLARGTLSLRHFRISKLLRRCGFAGRWRFPRAARAQAAPLHEPKRRQPPPFGGMGGGRALQIGAAHKGGRPGRGDSPDVEVLRPGHSGTIVSLWHFCISYRRAYRRALGDVLYPCAVAECDHRQVGLFAVEPDRRPRPPIREIDTARVCRTSPRERLSRDRVSA